jgi:hypothetical protein
VLKEKARDEDTKELFSKDLASSSAKTSRPGEVVYQDYFVVFPVQPEKSEDKTKH